MERKLSNTVLDVVNQQERFEYLNKIFSKKNSKRDLLFFIAGFFESDGSLWISINKSPKHPFGIQLNFGFSVYQHESNKHFLDLYLFYFKTGRIELKLGSKNVYQFVINSRVSLQEKVKPFIFKYSQTFGTKTNNLIFFDVLESMEVDKLHLTKEGLCSLVEKVYQMESFKGKKRKRELFEVIQIIRDHV